MNTLRKNRAPRDDDETGNVFDFLRSDVNSDIWYKVPILNLFYSIIDITNPPEWYQVSQLLQTLGIVNALILSLVVSFYTTIDYEEMVAVDMRYSVGIDHPGHPLAGNSDYDTAMGSRYLEFRDNDCYGLNKSQTCIDTWNSLDINTTGWLPAVQSGNKGSAHYPFCFYPCYADRPLSTSGNGNIGRDSWVTGNYARYWMERMVFQDLDKDFDPSDTEVLCVDSDGTNICKTEKRLVRLTTPTQDFSATCAMSISFLAGAMLLSILVLVVGSSNGFNRGTEMGSFLYQYRTVAKSYLYWIRWANILIILLTMIGVVQFLQSMKALVYIKYTDTYIAQHGLNDVSGWFGLFTVGVKSPYNFVLTANLWMFYIPFALCAVLLSVGVYKMNSFPATSSTDMNNVSNSQLAARREAYAKDLTRFLVLVGGLASVEVKPKEGKNQVPNGPRRGWFGLFGRTQQTGFRSSHGVFLSGAGGDSGPYAEIVADSLIDHGIYDVRALIRLILHDQLGGIGELGPMYGMTTISDGAVLNIMMGLRKFAALYATDNELAGEDENEMVSTVQCPSSYMQYAFRMYDEMQRKDALPETKKEAELFGQENVFIQHCFVKDTHIHGWTPMSDSGTAISGVKEDVAFYVKRALYTSDELNEAGCCEVPTGKWINSTWGQNYKHGADRVPVAKIPQNVSATDQADWEQVSQGDWLMRIPNGGVATGAPIAEQDCKDYPISVLKYLQEQENKNPAHFPESLKGYDTDEFKKNNPIIPVSLEVPASTGFTEHWLPALFFHTSDFVMQQAFLKATDEKGNHLKWTRVKEDMFVKDMSHNIDKPQKVKYVEYLPVANVDTFANLKLDCVILWYMEMLKNISFEHDDKLFSSLMLIPDARLFPREHQYVMEWLKDPRNLEKDPQLAFIEVWGKDSMTLPTDEEDDEAKWCKMAKVIDAYETKSLFHPEQIRDKNHRNELFSHLMGM